MVEMREMSKSKSGKSPYPAFGEWKTITILMQNTPRQAAGQEELYFTASVVPLV